MLRRLLVPALLASAMAVPAAADNESRYSEWQPEGTEATELPGARCPRAGARER